MQNTYLTPVANQTEKQDRLRLGFTPSTSRAHETKLEKTFASFVAPPPPPPENIPPAKNSPLDLFLLDRFEDLDHALGVIQHVHPLENLAVLPPADFAYHFVVLLIPPIHHEALIVPVLPGPMDVHVRIHPFCAEEGNGKGLGVENRPIAVCWKRFCKKSSSFCPLFLPPTNQ